MSGCRLCPVLLVLLSLCGALHASRIDEHEVSVTFAFDGSLLQTTRLRVVADDDLVPWTPLRLVLRDHQTLEEFSAVAFDGRRPGRSVKGIRHRSSASIVEGTRHSVLTTHWFEVPPAKDSTVSFSYSVRSTPVFPEAAVEIPLDDPCRSVRIEIADPPPGFRYRLARGEMTKVGVEGGGIVVTRPSPCDSGAGYRPRQPLTLHFAWGAARSWPELGRLYHELLQHRSDAETELERRARALIAGEPADAVERLDLLLDFVKREIRNVAVELREGWYVPAPPATVLARGWGDCKDKALLLSKLLAAAGIEAYPALVDSGVGQAHFDPAFPRLSAFDHVVVAVAEEVLREGGAGRWIFVDPTLPASDRRALRPLLVGRTALVLRDGDRSSLETVRGTGDSNEIEPSRARATAELPR